jgi:hypothetical protein
MQAQTPPRSIGVKLTFGSIGVKLTFGSAVAVLALAVVAGPAAAASPPAYNRIPFALPGNVVSIGFQATSTSEFGDYITLGGTERSRTNRPVTVCPPLEATPLLDPAQFPALVVGDRVARNEASQRAQRLEFDGAFVAVDFQVATHVRMLGLNGRIE